MGACAGLAIKMTHIHETRRLGMPQFRLISFDHRKDGWKRVAQMRKMWRSLQELKCDGIIRERCRGTIKIGTDLTRLMQS